MLNGCSRHEINDVMTRRDGQVGYHRFLKPMIIVWASQFQARRGLLCDCEIFADGSFAALVRISAALLHRDVQVRP